jgi:hypothetical protein
VGPTAIASRFARVTDGSGIDSALRIERVIAVFNRTMKIAASVGVIAIAVGFTYCMVDRQPLPRDTWRLPAVTEDVLLAQSTSGEFAQRLRTIIARADAAKEPDRASLPKAQIVPDPTRNAVPQGFVFMATRQ